MTDTNQLPPLPMAVAHITVGDDTEDVFTADQMRAYALQSRAQLAQGEPVSDEQIQQVIDSIPGAWRASTLFEFARAILALRPAAQEVQRPQNCGTSYCSCIECVMEPAPQQATPEPVGEPVGRTIGNGSGQALIYDTTLPDSTPVYHRPAHAAQAVPMTRDEREAMYARAEARIQKDQNLSWRDAIVSETEAHHGITAQGGEG